MEPPASQAAEAALTVAQLVEKSAAHLKALWPAPVWVRGELSNVRRYASGHVYLTLKDASAEISGVMFASSVARNGNLPGEGSAVAALCRPTVYVPKGRFQIVINRLVAQGQGRLYEQFIRTKAELKAKGWFDAERKRIPRFPRSVAVVVSPQGAAWRDVRTTLSRRFPCAAVTVYPAPAQGKDAPGKIALAIRRAAGCEVLIVCRGGGSFEDLHAYNDMQVAEAIFTASVPVITGIGHETDETIADYTADLRAATPTAAAVAAVPDRAELLQHLAGLQLSLAKAAGDRLNLAGARIDDHAGDLRDAARRLTEVSGERLAHLHTRCAESLKAAQGAKLRFLRQVQTRLYARMRFVHDCSYRLGQAAAALPARRRRQFAQYRQRLDHVGQRLDSLNPRRTLQRGYAIVTDARGAVISSSARLRGCAGAVVELGDGAVAVTPGSGASSKLQLPDDHNASAKTDP